MRLFCSVIDNGAFEMIRMHHEHEFPERVSGSKWSDPGHCFTLRRLTE